MKTTKLFQLLTLLFILTFSSGHLLAQKTKLQLKLAKGATYSLQMVTDQLISQEIMGTKQDVNQKITMKYDFNLEDIAPNGLYTIDVTYRTFSINQESPMGKMEYDSEKPSANTPDAFKSFAAIVGNSFQIKLTPEGQVKEVSGVDSLMEKMVNTMNISDETQKASIKNSLKAQFGDQALRSSMEMMMAIYPDKPVGVGDTWNKSISVAMGIPMQINSSYTLKGRQNGLANIDIKSVISSADGAPMEISGMKMTYLVEGEQSGTMQLDEKTGFTKSSDMNQNLSGTITMSGAPQMQEPMTWPITITSHVVLKAI